jgi:hypothetical protein
MLESCRHNGKLSLNCSSGELGVLTARGDFTSKIWSAWTVKMLPDGKAEFSVERNLFGNEFANFKRFFDNITPEKERQYWDQQFSGVLAGSELTKKSYDFNYYPGKINMTFTVPGFWKKSGDYISFTLPDDGFADLIRTAGKRTLPYWFKRNYAKVNTFVVSYPAEWKYCELEGGSFEFSMPESGGEVLQQVEVKPGLLDIQMASFIDGTVYVETQYYGMLENLQKKLSNPATRTFLFKSIGK